MKMWKKLMAFAGALLLITAILAAQYVSVQLDSVVVGIDTREAGLQIGAGDPSVISEGLGGVDHYYMLEYVEGLGFQLNLGVWGEQNAFTSTAAFFIANALPEDVYIVGAEITGVAAENITGGSPPIVMYLHNNSHEAELNGNYVNLLEIVAGTEYVHLAGVTDAYETGLEITGTDDAVWAESSDGGSNLWRIVTPGEIDNLGIGEDGTASACWVRVEVSPTHDIATGELTIILHTASAAPTP